MIDAGTTMFIIKLGKRMPDDLSVAREAKVKTFLQFQLLIVFFILETNFYVISKVYRGNECPLVMKKEYFIRFTCDFELR